MHGTHQEMRQILDSVLQGEAREEPDVLVRDIPDVTPWRKYIANHKQWREIIGAGINHVFCKFLQTSQTPISMVNCGWIS